MKDFDDVLASVPKEVTNYVLRKKEGDKWIVLDIQLVVQRKLKLPRELRLQPKEPKPPTPFQIAREEARKKGLLRYEGKPCLRGHTSRSVASDVCMDCRDERQRTAKRQSSQYTWRRFGRRPNIYYYIVDGVRYDRTSELLNRYEITPDILTTRCTSQEWPSWLKFRIDDGTQVPKRQKRIYGKPCIIDDVYYATRSEAARAYGVDKATIDYWVRHSKNGARNAV